MKYPYLKWQRIFSSLCREFFLSPIIDKTFIGLDYIFEKHGECLIRSRNYLPFVSPWIRPRLLVWSVLLTILVFGVFVFYLSSSCVLCVQCCQCFWLSLRFSLTFICNKNVDVRYARNRKIGKPNNLMFWELESRCYLLFYCHVILMMIFDM